jgi:hypothetical protein
MSFLVTRGLGAGNLVTAGLAVQLGVLTPTSTAGSLALAGILITTFIPAPVDDEPTNSYGRRFFGTFYGPRGKRHS